MLLLIGDTRRVCSQEVCSVDSGDWAELRCDQQEHGNPGLDASGHPPEDSREKLEFWPKEREMESGLQ